MNTGRFTSGSHVLQSSCPKHLVALIDKLRSAYFSHDAKIDISGRGDELEEASEFHQLAKMFENCRQRREAVIAEAMARELVAKELNELDGFDR